MRYEVARGGESEPGLILVCDTETGRIIARSSDMALADVRELVAHANAWVARQARKTKEVATTTVQE